MELTQVTSSDRKITHHTQMRPSGPSRVAFTWDTWASRRSKAPTFLFHPKLFVRTPIFGTFPLGTI